MMRQAFVAVLLWGLVAALPACKSQQTKSPESEYDQLSPFENKRDPYATDAVSLKGLDRSDWPQVVFRPAGSGLKNQVDDFSPVPMGDDAVRPLLAPQVDWQMAEAMSGARAGNWNGENATDALAAPFVATADVLMLPVHAAEHVR